MSKPALEIRSMQGMARAAWSEEVYTIEPNSQANCVNTMPN